MFVCNMCGEPCEAGGSNAGLIDCNVAGEYFSTPGNGYGALDDCTEYHFSMCEFCLDWLFDQFRLPPKVFCRINGVDENWRPAIERVTNDNWRTSKKEFLDKCAKRNGLRSIRTLENAIKFALALKNATGK